LLTRSLREMVRVAVTHSYIAKGTQVLKLNVE
jgi:hypothetical protein